MAIGSTRLFYVGIGLVLAFAAGPAGATPIQYDFTGGTATLEVEVSGIGTVVDTTAPLVGTFATFDAMVPALTDVNWVIADTIPLGLLLGTLDVNVVVTDNAVFSAPATATGPGTYDWSGGSFDVLATVALSGGLAGPLGPTQFSSNVPTADGTVTIAGNTATFTASRQAMFSFVHSGKTVTIFSTISFTGVPEPGLAALLLVAGGGFWASQRRSGRGVRA